MVFIRTQSPAYLEHGYLCKHSIASVMEPLLWYMGHLHSGDTNVGPLPPSPPPILLIFLIFISVTSVYTFPGPKLRVSPECWFH